MCAMLESAGSFLNEEETEAWLAKKAPEGDPEDEDLEDDLEDDDEDDVEDESGATSLRTEPRALSAGATSLMFNAS